MELDYNNLPPGAPLVWIQILIHNLVLLRGVDYFIKYVDPTKLWGPTKIVSIQICMVIQKLFRYPTKNIPYANKNYT